MRPHMTRTRTDSGATEWRIKDEVVRLRAWATDVTFALPPPPADSVVVGTAETCLFRLIDPLGYISREHAVLKRQVQNTREPPETSSRSPGGWTDSRGMG